MAGEQYIESTEYHGKRCQNFFEKILWSRLDDIERFFVNGMQKDPIQRWLEGKGRLSVRGDG